MGRQKPTKAWGSRAGKRQRSYARAWAHSVPALSAPVGVAPSPVILRRIADCYPMVQIRWDWRPRRRTFVLWEKSTAGDWVVIQDIPRGHPIDQRIIDHLALCDMAMHGGQGIIDAVDAMGEKVRRERIAEGRRFAATDWDRILWAAQKDAVERDSVPYNVRTNVPAQIVRSA